MKATLWVYSSAVYEGLVSEVFFWKDSEINQLDASDADEAVSRELEADGSLPVEGEELDISFERFNGAGIRTYVVEIAHPTYPEEGKLVCKTFIHAFTDPKSFERLKSTPGWIYGK